MSLNLQNSQTNELLYIGFNQDYSCFAVGTDQGFRIYNSEPFKETFRRDFSSGGIGMVEMLYRCNILALVGGGRNPRYPPHKVMIWDDHQNRCIGELSFRAEVKAVRLRRDRVVVALEKRVYIYNFADLTLVDHIETSDNPRGLLALCAHPNNNVLACPGSQKGYVRLELYDQRKTTMIAAHETSLACIALNSTGTYIATASEKGTLIRVYDTFTGELVQELRRGADKASINCLAFNANTTLLACTSDKGTVHIFKLRDFIRENSTNKDPSMNSVGGINSQNLSSSAYGTQNENKHVHSESYSQSGNAGHHVHGHDNDSHGDHQSTGLSFMKQMLPKYFSSDWSYAQFRVPEGKYVCAFGTEVDSIIVIGADGSYFKASFKKGGEATRVAYSQLSNSNSTNGPLYSQNYGDSNGAGMNGE